MLECDRASYCTYNIVGSGRGQACSVAATWNCKVMLKNISSTWGIVCLAIVGNFFILPFNIHHVGSENYGVWLIITSMTGYLLLLQNGIPTAVERRLAHSRSRSSDAELVELMSTAIVLMVAIAILTLLIGLGVYFFVTQSASSPYEFSFEARVAFLVSLAHVILTILLLPATLTLAAHHKFVFINSASAAALMVRFAANVALVVWNPSIVSIGAALIIAMVVEISVMWWMVLGKYKYVRFEASSVRWSVVKGIAWLAAMSLILSIGFQFSFQSDALVIGAFLSNKDVTTFGVANTLVIYLTQFAISISVVAMPLASELYGKGDFEELRTIFLKWSKITIMLSWLVCAFLLVFGGDFLGAWVGDALREPGGRVLVILIASNLILLPMRGLAMPFLFAFGKVGVMTAAVVVTGIMNLAISIWLVVPLGLDGVAYGTAIPNVILALVLLYLVCRELDLSLVRYVGEVFGKAAVGFGVVVAVFLAAHEFLPTDTLFGVIVSGVLVTGLYGAVWLVFVLRGDRHLHWQEAGRFLPRGWRRGLTGQA